jgi:O-antigen ligase
METWRVRLSGMPMDRGLVAAGLASALAAAAFAWSAYVLSPLALPLLFAALAFVILAFAHPWIGVAGAMLAIPMELVAVPLPTGSLSPAEGALALTGVVYASRLLFRPQTVRAPSLRDLPFAILLAAISVGLTFAEDPAPVTRTLILWTLWYAVYLQVQSFDLREIKRVVAALVIGAGILGAVGAAQFGATGDAGVYAGGAGVSDRVAGTFGTEDDSSATNYFASALELAALPAIVMLVAFPRRNAWMAIPAAAIVVGLLLSLSRGGTLGFAGGLLLLVALWGRARAAVTAIAVVAIGLTVAGLNPLIGTEQVETVGQRLSSATNFESSSSNLRPQAYSEAIELTAENPVFGIGVNQFRSTVAKRGQGLSEQGAPLEGAHNVFLSLGAETGLVGLGAFCFFVAMVVGRARAALRSRDPLGRALALGFAAALAGFAIQGMTVTQNRNHLLWGTFLVVAGLLVALGDRADAAAATPATGRTEPALGRPAMRSGAAAAPASAA